MSINLTEIIFETVARTKIFRPTPKLTYDVILALKMTQFSQKMTNFDHIDPINDIFTKVMLINLTEIIFPNF